MPYFVRVGVVEQNLSGVGTRGYHLFRRGRTVVARWGPVEVLPGRQFRWVYRRERRYTMRSEAVAIADYERRVADRMESYDRLPRGVSIGGAG